MADFFNVILLLYFGLNFLTIILLFWFNDNICLLLIAIIFIFLFLFLLSLFGIKQVIIELFLNELFRFNNLFLIDIHILNFHGYFKHISIKFLLDIFMIFTIFQLLLLFLLYLLNFLDILLDLVDLVNPILVPL